MSDRENHDAYYCVSTSVSTIRQFEMSTQIHSDADRTELHRVRLMYAMLSALGHKPMLTESPGHGTVRVNCTQAQWDEAVHHVDWINLQCNLRKEVP